MLAILPILMWAEIMWSWERPLHILFSSLHVQYFNNSAIIVQDDTFHNCLSFMSNYWKEHLNPSTVPKAHFKFNSGAQV